MYTILYEDEYDTKINYIGFINPMIGKILKYKITDDIKK